MGSVTLAQVPAFETFAKDRSVTYVYVSRGILSLAGSVDYTQLGLSPDMQKVIHKLDALQVIRSDGPKSSGRTEKSVQRILQKGRYTRVMQLDEAGKEVTVYQGSSDDATVLVMCSREGPGYIVTVFSGTFTLDEIVELVRH